MLYFCDWNHFLWQQKKTSGSGANSAHEEAVLCSKIITNLFLWGRLTIVHELFQKSHLSSEIAQFEFFVTDLSQKIAKLLFQSITCDHLVLTASENYYKWFSLNRQINQCHLGEYFEFFVTCHKKLKIPNYVPKCYPMVCLSIQMFV